MRIITVGPLPPEWGGPRPGGVATSHRLVLEGLRKDHDVAVITWTQSDEVDVLRPNKSDPESWYEEQAAKADVVLMFHVSHPWAIYHARRKPTPAVGSVRSWSPVLEDPGKRTATIEGISGMEVLVFPTSHSRTQGQELGFSYPVPTLIVRNALASVFVEENFDLDQQRRGVVFAGSSSVPIKRLEVAEEACRRLGVDLRVISGRPQGDVRSAMLSAEALCVPSSSEATGNVYIEAAACGTPSVGYGPAINEISRDAGLSIGESADPDTVEALRRVLSAQWDRHAMRAGVVTNYTMENTLAGYEDAFAVAIARYKAQQ